jgi:hypothetical protein
VTAAEIIERADIVAVARDLGFDVGRSNRAPCLICGATNPTTLSLMPDTKTWRCFRCNRRGGVLKLIKEINDGTPADALRWLADNLGLPPTDRPLTPAERQGWHRKRTQAESRAVALTAWREDTLQRIRDRRNELYDQDRQVCAWACWALENDASEEDWEFAWNCINESRDAERLDRWVERIEAMKPAALLALRERMEARAA